MAEDDEMSQQDAQEAAAQLQYLQSVYTQRYDMLSEQVAAYNLAREGVARSMELIDKIDSVEGSNVLLNLDGGMYIEAGVKKVDNIITYIGSGYLVEKTMPEAKEFLERAAKESESSAARLMNERKKVENELFDISYRMAALRQG